jgi:RepB DNA-primase from phage plasmid
MSHATTKKGGQKQMSNNPTPNPFRIRLGDMVKQQGRSFEEMAHSVIRKETSLDKTESTVRVMLTAIEAPLYDVGVLSERGMLPRLDGISAATVLDRLPLLKYRNAHGSHIYIRPSGEHRYTTLDDLSETSLSRLSGDGFNPCAVVETSAGNFQAWLRHSRTFPKLPGTFAAQTLAERYDADPSAADWRRFGRLPGFTNCKPKYRKSDGLFPFVRLHSHSGEQYLSRDPSASKRAAYIRRTIEKAKRWVER